MKYDINRNPSPAAVFFLSLAPGVGHMYMGLMIRGLQLLVAFMLCCAFLSFSREFSFIIGPAMVVLYIFNIFDAYNCRKKIQGGADIGDESFMKIDGKYVGGALVVLGILGLLFTMRDLRYMADWFYSLVGNVIRLLPSVLLLGVGLVLITRARKKGRKDKNGEDAAA